MSIFDLRKQFPSKSFYFFENGKESRKSETRLSIISIKSYDVNGNDVYIEV